MAINKAMVTGTKGLMDWLDRNSISPYYSVWCGKQLLFSWNDDDKEAGSNKLENDLYAIEQNGVGDLLTIKLHPKRKKAVLLLIRHQFTLVLIFVQRNLNDLICTVCSLWDQLIVV